MSNLSVKVRFAPSPTGELHIGGVRTALFNWLFAKNQGGKFYLRIEDTDAETIKRKIYRSNIGIPGMAGSPLGPAPSFTNRNGWMIINRAQRICSTRAGFTAVFAPRMIYSPPGMRATTFIRAPCRNLTDDAIKVRLNQGQNFTFRFRVLEGETIYKDLIYGQIHVDHKELDDFIVVRSDGSPTYNYVNVIDDHDMGITHVIRGEDHVSNTPKQILIYKALGYDEPTFAHLPMILGHDKKRLSKRHGAPGVQNFRDEGYLPESLINYLALLGWNPGTEEEILSPNELIEKI